MTDSRKRVASDIPTTSPERPTKAPKTSKAGSTKTHKNAKKGGPKAPMGAAAFKEHALPLHLNVTHTPPAITGEATGESASDSGFIGTTSLVPCTFSTGSYGWKGNKRITVELLNNESGVKEKVQVMLTVNATVLGSKNAKGDDEQAEDKEAPEEPEGHEKSNETA